MRGFGIAMRFGIALVTADFIFLLLVRRFSGRALRLGRVGDQEFLSDLQFSGIVNVIERYQIAVRDFQFFGDAYWIVALLHNVSLSGRRDRLRLFLLCSRMRGFGFLLVICFFCR